MVLLGSSDFVRDSQLELRAPDEMRAGSIELTLDDRCAGSAEARAWRVDSGEGLVLESAALHDARTQEPPRPKPSLMPGRWRVEVRTPGRPWTSVGECRLAPGEQLDLGLVTLLPCADLVLSSTNPKSTEVQVALRAQIDGAIVTWPGRPVVLPTTIATISGTPLGILSSKTEGGESVLVNPEPRRFDAGSEQVVEIP